MPCHWAPTTISRGSTSEAERTGLLDDHDDDMTMTMMTMTMTMTMRERLHSTPLHCTALHCTVSLYVCVRGCVRSPDRPSSSSTPSTRTLTHTQAHVHTLTHTVNATQRNATRHRAWMVGVLVRLGRFQGVAHLRSTDEPTGSPRSERPPAHDDDDDDEDEAMRPIDARCGRACMDWRARARARARAHVRTSRAIDRPNACLPSCVRACVLHESHMCGCVVRVR